ncbi:MAG: hypothetical protein U0821_07290 [Chloroflexota bacterium]
MSEDDRAVHLTDDDLADAVAGLADERMRRHIAACAPCRDLVDNHRLVRAALAALPTVRLPRQHSFHIARRNVIRFPRIAAWSRGLASLAAAVFLIIFGLDVVGMAESPDQTARDAAPIAKLAVHPGAADAALMARPASAPAESGRDADAAPAARTLAQLEAKPAPATWLSSGSLPPTRFAWIMGGLATSALVAAAIVSSRLRRPVIEPRVRQA